MSNLNEVPTTANMGDFDALIEDGKMIITPSEAGIQLLAYIAKAEDQIEKVERDLDTSNDIINNLQQNNAELRDLLENVYAELMLLGSVGLAEGVLRKLYPITGTWEDGTTK